MSLKPMQYVNAVMRILRVKLSIDKLQLLNFFLLCWARILVQITIHRRLLIGRDGRLDQLKAYDIS